MAPKHTPTEIEADGTHLNCWACDTYLCRDGCGKRHFHGQGCAPNVTQDVEERKSNLLRIAERDVNSDMSRHNYGCVYLNGSHGDCSDCEDMGIRTLPAHLYSEAELAVHRAIGGTAIVYNDN